MKNSQLKLNRFHDLPLGWKFSCLIGGVVVMMGIVSIILVEFRMTSLLHDENEERALIIARNLAMHSVDLVLTGNKIKLHQILLKTKAFEKDVEYIFVLDPEKNIFAHTFQKNGFPNVLLEVNPFPAQTQLSYVHQEFEADGHNLHDLAVLIMDGKAGEVHIGFSLETIEQKTITLRKELVGVTSLVSLLGMAVALLFGRIINKPLQQLAIASGKIGHGELIYDLPIAAHDEIGRLTATFNDMVANMAKAKEKQRKAEEGRVRLAAAIDQAFETVVITDLQGDIQYVNPAFEKLTGYSSEEVIGHNPRVLKSGKHDRKFYEKMWGTLLKGEVWTGRLTNKKKDGTFFEEQATISPIRDSSGKINNFVAVKRDVSREVSLVKQLRQAMKMEAIGTLAGGIAHDFNNILAAILGYTEMARDGLSPEEPIAKDLDQVIKAAKRASDLVQQILTFSRQGDEDLHPVKAQSVIREVLKLIRASLPTTIELKEDIEQDCGKILADGTQLHQVMMNLCTNARHAIGDDLGVLTVSLAEIEVTRAAPIAHCPHLAPGRYMDLAISDTGCGMDELTMSRIFDPFFTTKGVGKGTGLGLPVVHGIIKQHKGEITVDSVVGQGTTFHVYLPIVAGGDTVSSTVGLEDILRGTGHILVVDDEVMVGEMLRRILEGLGYTVTALDSSVEALAVFKTNSIDFDLVITDMTMPEMTGVDLAQAILAIQPRMPIILCTGFSEAIDEAKAQSFGIQEYIKKPVDRRTLAKAVQKVLVSSGIENDS